MGLTIGLAGDVSLTSDTALQTPPDDTLKEFIGSLEHLIVNLESPLTSRSEVWTRHYSKKLDLPGGERVFLKGKPSAIDWLSRWQVTICNLANNHILDYGPDGVLNTIEELEAAGIDYVGAGRNRNEAEQPLDVNTSEGTLRLISGSFTAEATTRLPGAAPLHPRRLLRQVEAGTQEVEHVIVQLHAGAEFSGRPSRELEALSRALAAKGADVVALHHPHVLQRIERYAGSVIVYSLGNFLFPPVEYGVELAPKTRVDTGRSALVRVTLRAEEDPHLDYLPIELTREGSPSTATPRTATQIRARLANEDTPNRNDVGSPSIHNVLRLGASVVRDLDGYNAGLLLRRLISQMEMKALQAKDAIHQEPVGGLDQSPE